MAARDLMRRFLPIRIGRKSHDDFWTEQDVQVRSTLPRTSYAYWRDVQGGFDSNVVMAPVLWIMRTFTEAELIVQAKNARGVWHTVDDHPLVRRVNQPNEFYDGDELWKATIISYVLDGNAYWLLIRNLLGEVIEVWYVPHFSIEPKWDVSDPRFITHYEFRPGGGQVIPVPVRDVVHFRFGLDPRDVRRGFSPLRPLLREIFTDDEAANFTASLLRNMGVPGGVISPATSDFAALPSTEGVQAVRDFLQNQFTGDRRGRWLALDTPTKIEQFGYDPNQLMLGNLRDIAEERSCAMLGIPAAVVGFGSGLQQTRVGATMRELVRLARVNCINPMGKTFGKKLTTQLLPNYVSQLRRFRVRFDMSEVSVFQEDENERTKRTTDQVEKGVLRVDHAQQILGLDVDETQAGYLRENRFTMVEAETDPFTQPDPPPSGNGGGPDDEELMAIRDRVAQGNGR